MENPSTIVTSVEYRIANSMRPILPKAPPVSSLSSLDPDHQGYLDRLLNTILHSKVGEDAFAQIILGGSTHYSAARQFGACPSDLAEILLEQPSRQSVMTFEAFRAQLRSLDIRVNADILKAYARAPLSSLQFYLRLFEVLALAIHWLAGATFVHFHPHLPANASRNEWSEFQRGPGKHGLSHRYYGAYELYPYGILNMVGYWAETEIFGGVVLTGHKNNSWSKLESLWIHHTALGACQIPLSQFMLLLENAEPFVRDRVASILPLRLGEEPYFIGADGFGHHLYRDSFSAFFHYLGTDTRCVRPRTEEHKRMMEWAERFRQGPDVASCSPRQPI